ncbi:MAG: hypothetical protein FLDDKLPJ_01357 [Phycisphaerae bacterium]|nr:hypothetical protein [Phycisphaerae bacterium]
MRRHRYCQKNCVPDVAIGIIALAFTSYAAAAQDCPEREYGWTRTIGGKGFDSARAVAVDAQDNVYVCGEFTDKVDFDPTEQKDKRRSKGENDAFVSKYAPNGDYLMAMTIGSDGFDSASDLALHSSEGFVVVGDFDGRVDFDPGDGKIKREARGVREAFACRYSQDFVFDWVWTAGGKGEGTAANAWTVSIGRQNEVFIVGTFIGTVDFGENLGHRSSPTSRDVFVSKLADDGRPLWVSTFGGSTRDHATASATDSTGNIYITGEFTGTADFDPGEGEMLRTSNGSRDVFVLKLDSSGNLAWVRTIGGVGDDVGLALMVSDSDEAYIGGYFEDSVDFDPEGSGDVHDTGGASFHAFVTRVSADNEYRWTKTFGGSGLAYVDGIAQYADRQLVLVGGFFGAVDFDPSAGRDERLSEGKRSCYVGDWSLDGDYCSTQTFGGAALDAARGVAVDGAGAVRVVGEFGSPVVDFDPTRGKDKRRNRGVYDGFVVGLDH